MKIVTPDEMKAMDRRAVEEGLFSSLRLMQNAAEALYREVTALMEERGFERVLLLAGPGNNGGDAYALACLLHPHYQPAVLPVGGEDRSPDCAYYYEKCKELGVPFVETTRDYPLVVDGIFGTGFRDELPPEIAALLGGITAPMVAIDVPTGMYGLSGRYDDRISKPMMTVTFAFKKPCHLLADCGKVVVADIGIPADYAEEITRQELTPVLPRRTERGHKNTYGTVGLRVGSARYPGAGALALMGALRSGAGLVYGYLPRKARNAASAKLYGPVLFRRFDYAKKGSCQALLFGSGVGRSPLAARELKAAWSVPCPLVVDGDGLWHLSRMKAAPRRHPVVLTPHLKEFSLLCGKSLPAIKANRLALAEEFARKYHIILVLKDAVTVVTDGFRTEILSAPCSALAKGGSGDLLAGLTAGLLLGRNDPLDAAKTAVWLHNRSGHLAAEANSARSLQPEEIAAYINNAWMELENGAF